LRSKKRSAAKSAPPESFVFFVDESLGAYQVPGALRKAGLRVEIHRDHFSPGCADHVWLGHAGRSDWIVLTKDDRIRYRETEKGAILRAGARAFVLAGGNLSGEEMAQAYLQALERMIQLASELPAPFVASVGRSGEVRVLIQARRSRRPTKSDA
jgi:hypothetical protein